MSRVLVLALFLTFAACTPSPTSPTSSSPSSPSLQSAVTVTTNSGTAYRLTYESFAFSNANGPTNESFSIRRTDCTTISITKATLQQLRITGRSVNRCLASGQSNYVYDISYAGGSTSGWGPNYEGAGGRSVDDGRSIFVRMQDLSSVDVQR